MPRIEVATPPPDDLLYEAITTQTGISGMIRRGGRLGDLALTSNNMLDNNLGTPVQFVRFKRYWEGGTSGASSFGRQATTTPMDMWPIGVDASVIAPRYQYPARYRWTILVYRDTVPVLDVPFGVTLLWTDGTQNLLSLMSNIHVGYEISSRSTVNGGRWTLYRREVSAGALSSLDLGVDPAAGPALLGFEYDHGATNPKLRIIVNTVRVEIVGTANLVQSLTYTSGYQRHAVTQNGGAVVGQTDMWSRSHLIITRLPGYTVA